MAASTPTTVAQMVSTVYSAGLDVSLSLLLAIGVLTIGAEYRHKTISATFLGLHRRLRQERGVRPPALGARASRQ